MSLSDSVMLNPSSKKTAFVERFAYPEKSVMERLRRIARAGLVASGYYSDDEMDVDNVGPSYNGLDHNILPRMETERPVELTNTLDTNGGGHQGWCCEGVDFGSFEGFVRGPDKLCVAGDVVVFVPYRRIFGVPLLVVGDRFSLGRDVTGDSEPATSENTPNDHPLVRYARLSFLRDTTSAASPISPALSISSTASASSNPSHPGTPPEQVEEGSHVYHPGGFHPVRLFEVYNSRYLVLRKLGWGRYSTVWLVRDMQHHSSPAHPHSAYYAMKVLSAECYYAKHPVYEREILRHLRSADKSHPGYKHMCHLLDDFEHQGPNGVHVCLVFEVMGETMHTFTRGFYGGEVDNEVMRGIVVQLLLALKFAHGNGVIHTDIKQDNIFLRFQAPHSVIETVFLPETIPDITPADQPYRPIRSVHMRRVYRIGPTAPPIVALGDFGIATWAHRHLTEATQPVALRAPEVLLHAPWDHRADLWNLGAIVMEMFRNRRMFHPYMHPPPVDPNDTNNELAAYCNASPRVNRYGMVYFIPEHLHQMEVLFGSFPEALLKRASPRLLKQWFNKRGEVRSSKGYEWKAVCSMWHESWMGNLDEKHAAEFYEWIYCVMRIDPEMRPTIDQLLRHRWLREAEMEE